MGRTDLLDDIDRNWILSVVNCQNENMIWVFTLKSESLNHRRGPEKKTKDIPDSDQIYLRIVEQRRHSSDVDGLRCSECNTSTSAFNFFKFNQGHSFVRHNSSVSYWPKSTQSFQQIGFGCLKIRL